MDGPCAHLSISFSRSLLNINTPFILVASRPWPSCTLNLPRTPTNYVRDKECTTFKAQFSEFKLNVAGFNDDDMGNTHWRFVSHLNEVLERLVQILRYPISLVCRLDNRRIVLGPMTYIQTTVHNLTNTDSILRFVNFSAYRLENNLWTLREFRVHDCHFVHYYHFRTE